MKNRTRIIVILACAVMLLLAGCSSPAALTLEADFGVTVDGTWYPIMQDASAVVSALGDDYEQYTLPSCAFVGEDKEFEYESCSVFTNPDGDADIWYLISFWDDTLETARGIRIGSTRDELLDAYGSGYYMEDTTLVYSISGVSGDVASPCILFGMDGDSVSSVEIYYPADKQ